MKKTTILLISTACLLITAHALAGNIDMPDKWPGTLKAGTRDMITAGIEPDKAVNMTRDLIKAGFKERLVIRAQQLVTTAHQKGLPSEAIIEKAHEGIAKRVPAALIVRAMERVESRYAYSFIQAGKLVSGVQDKQRLGKTIASGIAAGLTVEDVEAMIRGLKTKTAGMDSVQGMALAFEILESARDMVRRGVSSQAAALAVNRTMNRGKEKARHGENQTGAKGDGRGNPGSGSGNGGSGGGGHSGKNG